MHTTCIQHCIGRAFYNIISSCVHVFYAPLHHFHRVLILLGVSHTMVVSSGPLMTTHVLSLPTVMTTELLSLPCFSRGLYQVTGSIQNSLMRKCLVLSYTQWHQFEGDYLRLTSFLGHLLHELSGCHQHAINLDVKDEKERETVSQA